MTLSAKGCIVSVNIHSTHFFFSVIMINTFFKMCRSSLTLANCPFNSRKSTLETDFSFDLE